MGYNTLTINTLSITWLWSRWIQLLKRRNASKPFPASEVHVCISVQNQPSTLSNDDPIVLSIIIFSVHGECIHKHQRWLIGSCLCLLELDIPREPSLSILTPGDKSDQWLGVMSQEARAMLVLQLNQVCPLSHPGLIKHAKIVYYYL